MPPLCGAFYRWRGLDAWNPRTALRKLVSEPPDFATGQVTMEKGT